VWMMALAAIYAGKNRTESGRSKGRAEKWSGLSMGENMFIPPCSPELNPVENIWQFLRQTYLSNQVFEDYDKIVNACSKAGNNLIGEAGRITSIASRK